MKKDKWLKWQIGAVGALAIGLLFQQVKGSAAFAKAHEQTLAAKSKQADTESSGELALGDGFDKRAADGGQTGIGAPPRGNQGTERANGPRARMPGNSGGGQGQSGDTQLTQPNGTQPNTQSQSGRTQTRTGRS
ncbi:hypothetical protein [Paenibacillus sp. MBLB4367]|uniref:hypothetical protein n=1 Tax=Paenibacillus sp. MBLB4367 TaxID=3384767 RepID=UPI00390835B6